MCVEFIQLSEPNKYRKNKEFRRRKPSLGSGTDQTVTGQVVANYYWHIKFHCDYY